MDTKGKRIRTGIVILNLIVLLILAVTCYNQNKQLQENACYYTLATFNYMQTRLIQTKDMDYKGAFNDDVLEMLYYNLPESSHGVDGDFDEVIETIRTVLQMKKQGNQDSAYLDEVCAMRITTTKSKTGYAIYLNNR